MLDAVSTWRDAVADMIPEVPRGVPASTRISEEQVLAWIEEDRATIPADVNGQGIVYRFDIRDYCGHMLIDTSDPEFALFYGGSDDDLAFAASKLDLT